MSKPSGDTRELTFTLTTEDVNLILESLGQLPFIKVYGLVAKLQQQARQQLERKPEDAADAT